MGLSLKNVTLRVTDYRGRTVFTELGELLFTHFGLSGPLVLSASAHLRDFDKNRYTAQIDLKPGLSEEQLDKRLLRDFIQFSQTGGLKMRLTSFSRKS
jgi:predicted flavoprotein YhiN